MFYKSWNGNNPHFLSIIWIGENVCEEKELHRSHGQNSAPLKIHENRSPSGTNIHKPFVYPISRLTFTIQTLHPLQQCFFSFKRSCCCLYLLLRIALQVFHFPTCAGCYSSQIVPNTFIVLHLCTFASSIMVNEEVVVWQAWTWMPICGWSEHKTRAMVVVRVALLIRFLSLFKHCTQTHISRVTQAPSHLHPSQSVISESILWMISLPQPSIKACWFHKRGNM